MKETTKAYAAGILDAEGCLSIRKQIRIDKPINFASAIIIQTTSKELSNWMKHHFGGSIRFRKSVSDHWKDSFRWEIHNAVHGRRFLLQVLPYLRIKKKEAELLLKYYALESARSPASREILFDAATEAKQSSVTTETPSFSQHNNLRNAYVAGLLDGEGSFQIGRAPQNRSGFQYIPRVVICNTNIDCINTLPHEYHGFLTHQNSRQENHRPLHTWCLTQNKQLEQFILSMLPYLIIKKQRANIVLEFLRMNGQQNPSKRQLLFDALKKLNHRGKMIQSELHGRP